MKASPDNYLFSGWATKAEVECSDGRTISPSAFEHNSGSIVPVVWQHKRGEIKNILGNAYLEHRDGKGVYSYIQLNDTDEGNSAKERVKHGDIDSLSIYATDVIEKDKYVLHGNIKEVSLVFSGANPEAKIDNVIVHGEEVDSEVFISFPSSLEFNHSDDAGIEHEKTRTLKDIYDTMTDAQKDVVHIMVASALDGDIEFEDDQENQNEVQQSDEPKGEEEVKRNIFEQQDGTEDNRGVLTADDLSTIVSMAKKGANGSLAHAFEMYVESKGGDFEHAITNIDYLFPEAQVTSATPHMYSRKMEWVDNVFGKAHKTPFARVKNVIADITPAEARAKGYVTGAQKADQVVALLKRVTNPTTVYKKNSIDRDDMIDITDINIVAWLKMEMRFMLEEEIARAVLVGDGRSVAHADKIDESCIRPIYGDDALYSFEVQNAVDATVGDIIDSVVANRASYMGSGTPTFYGTPAIIAQMLLLKDTTGRRLYKNKEDLSAALLVKEVVEVPVLDGIIADIDGATGAELQGIVVNMADYTIGADKGGKLGLFDDFDIDYNKHKYLMETRCSGALTKPKSAMVITKVVTTP